MFTPPTFNYEYINEQLSLPIVPVIFFSFFFLLVFLATSYRPIPGSTDTDTNRYFWAEPIPIPVPIPILVNKNIVQTNKVLIKISDVKLMFSGEYH